MTEAENNPSTQPVDCTEETAQRAGAKKTSLTDKDTDEHSAKPDIDKDNVSEDDLDEALDDSMDASDPPSFTQP